MTSNINKIPKRNQFLYSVGFVAREWNEKHNFRSSYVIIVCHCVNLGKIMWNELEIPVKAFPTFLLDELKFTSTGFTKDL